MSTVTVSVNAITAAASAVLSFAFVPRSLVVGMTIADNTAPSVLNANAAVTAIDLSAGTVTMNLPAVGAGVGATDSLTFTASDTIDNATIYLSLTSPGFLARVQTLWLYVGSLILSASPTNNQQNFVTALTRNQIGLQILAEYILNTTNRANLLLDATMPGGKMVDTDIVTQIENVFTNLANARNWSSP